MDIETIKIKIDTGELKSARDDLNKLINEGKKTDETVKGLSSSFLGLNQIISGVALYSVAKQAVETADKMNLLDSRLKLATKSTEEYTSQQIKLTAIAKGSYTSISDTLTLFIKLQPALSQVGASTSQVNRVLETFQKGLQLGGASVEESKSAILQFAQAMGSGVLRGEEFNAMAEASPKLMAYMAEGLGVPQTALRKMAEQGELTASSVGNALLKMSQQVDKDFATMPVTVGKAMTNLTTDISLFIREADKITGTTNNISNQIQSLSGYLGSLSTEQLSNMVELIKNGGIAFATSAIAITAYNKALDFVKTSTAETFTATTLLKGALNTIPFVAIATGLTLIATEMFNTSKATETMNKTLSTTRDELKKLTNNQLDYRESLLEEEAIKARLALNDAKARASKDSSTAKDKAERDEASKYFEEITGKLREIKNIRADKSLITTETSTSLKNLVVDFNKLPVSMQKIIDPIRAIKEEFAKVRKEAYDSGNATPQALANIARAEADAIESATKKMNKSQDEAKKKAQEIQRAYDSLIKEGYSEYDKKLYEISEKTADYILKSGDVTMALQFQKDAVAKVTEEENKRLKTISDEAINKKLAQEKDILDIREKQIGLIEDEGTKQQLLAGIYRERQQSELKAKLDTGAMTESNYKLSMNYEEQLYNKTMFRYSQTGMIIQDVASGMQSSMMTFFDYSSSGFLKLSNLVNDLGKLIYQAIVKQTIVSPLASALTSSATAFFSTPKVNAQGNVFNSPSLSNYSNSIVSTPTMFAFASGGVPNIGIMGEKNGGSPEAIIPLTRTANGDLGVRSVNDNSSQNMKIEVINQSNQSVEITNVSQRTDLEGNVISIVLNAIQTNKGGLRTAIGGR